MASAVCLVFGSGVKQPSGGKAKKYLAEYMDRLGVLLAVNAVAQKNHPNLLAADSYAQQLAASLATSNVAAIPRLR